jgi:hypothetical protein
MVQHIRWLLLRCRKVNLYTEMYRYVDRKQIVGAFLATQQQAVINSKVLKLYLNGEIGQC